MEEGKKWTKFQSQSLPSISDSLSLSPRQSSMSLFSSCPGFTGEFWSPPRDPSVFWQIRKLSLCRQNHLSWAAGEISKNVQASKFPGRRIRAPCRRPRRTIPETRPETPPPFTRSPPLGCWRAGRMRGHLYFIRGFGTDKRNRLGTRLAIRIPLALSEFWTEVAFWVSDGWPGRKEELIRRSSLQNPEEKNWQPPERYGLYGIISC